MMGQMTESGFSVFGDNVLMHLCRDFIFIIAVTTLISFFLRFANRRKEISEYVKLRKQELLDGFAPTAEGFKQCKKWYDEVYENHLENSKVYLSSTENKIICNFLKEYSEDFDTHTFKVSELTYAINKMKSIFVLLVEIIFAGNFAYANILMSPNGVGVKHSLYFLVFATILLLVKYFKIMKK